MSNLEQVRELYGAFGLGGLDRSPGSRQSSQNVAQVGTLQDGRITRFESFQDTLATAHVQVAVG